MRPMCKVLAGSILASLIACPSTRAEDWSLWPAASTTGTKKSSSKNEPGFFEKLGSGTKKLFTQTRDTITPKSAQKKKPQSVPWLKENKPAEKKPGFWDSLFAKKEPEKPRTASEWIAQPRPE